MSIRKLVLLLLVFLGVFLVFKFDLMTKARIGIANMSYGNEMKAINSFRILAEVSNPEIELEEGLSRESIREALATALEKAGIQSLPDYHWKKTTGMPSLMISVEAVKLIDRRKMYQYTVNIALTKSEPGSNILTKEKDKDKVIWSISEIGQGNIEDIRKAVIKVTDEFLRAHSDS